MVRPKTATKITARSSFNPICVLTDPVMPEEETWQAQKELTSKFLGNLFPFPENT